MIIQILKSALVHLLLFSSIIANTSYCIPNVHKQNSISFSNLASPTTTSKYTRCYLSARIDDNNGTPSDTATTESATEAAQAEQEDVAKFASTAAATPTSESEFLLGQWEEQHGNYVLRPPPQVEPRALIHFLGGAIVGAAPNLSYRYILEKLSNEGFLIVATPYNLSFDYLKSCDEILQKFERIAPNLARQYGPIPVIGVGHSCGALLQVLITCLFTDTPRAGNVLMSYNNKEVKDAVPLFEEVVIPFFQSVKGGGNTDTNDDSATSTSRDGVLALEMLLQALRISAERGELPSDDFLHKLSQSLLPKTSFTPPIPTSPIQFPAFLRSSITSLFLTPASSTLKSSGLLPVVHQTFNILHQIPLLIDEVATQNIRGFNPTKSSISTAIKRAYRARRTLLIQYKSDTFDETSDVESLLKDAEKVMRLKRPMIDFDLQTKVMNGVHATPLLAPPLDLDLIEKMENLVGDDLAKDKLFYKDADETVRVLVDWMEESL